MEYTQNFRLDEPALTTSSRSMTRLRPRPRRAAAARAHRAPHHARRQPRTLASARLVRMIGTRAPSTMPAASARDKKLRFLTRCCPPRGPAPRARRDRRRPARRCSRARRLRADGVVEREGTVQKAALDLATVGHLHSAAASMVDGILLVTVSTADRMATLGHSTPRARMKSIAFWMMVALVIERREDVDRRVGDREDL